MNKRGFVLLTVLWAIAALAALAAGAAALARSGSRVSGNRIGLTRAAWARDGCGEILMARFAADTSVRRVDTVELGRGTWCRAEIVDPAGAINVNAAGAELLKQILPDSATDALLDWRDPDDLPLRLGAEADWYRSRRRDLPRNGPLADVAELALIRGLEHLPPERLARLTTRGEGLIVRLEGGVHGTPIVSEAVLTVSPVQNRLAVIARESD